MKKSLDYAIRRALPEEAGEIRRLIYSERLMPVSLDWKRFLVAACPDGKLLGCGQVKPHRDATRELASIAVWPDYRRRGIASEVIRRLIVENPPPLYLTCRASLGPFYERFGFRSIPTSEMSPYFLWIKRAFSILKRFVPMEELLVMRLDR